MTYIYGDFGIYGFKIRCSAKASQFVFVDILIIKPSESIMRLKSLFHDQVINLMKLRF